MLLSELSICRLLLVSSGSAIRTLHLTLVFSFSLGHNGNVYDVRICTMILLRLSHRRLTFPPAKFQPYFAIRSGIQYNNCNTLFFKVIRWMFGASVSFCMRCSTGDVHSVMDNLRTASTTPLCKAGVWRWSFRRNRVFQSACYDYLFSQGAR